MTADVLNFEEGKKRLQKKKKEGSPGEASRTPFEFKLAQNEGAAGSAARAVTHMRNSAEIVKASKETTDGGQLKRLETAIWLHQQRLGDLTNEIEKIENKAEDKEEKVPPWALFVGLLGALVGGYEYADAAPQTATLASVGTGIVTGLGTGTLMRAYIAAERTFNLSVNSVREFFESKEMKELERKADELRQ